MEFKYVNEIDTNKLIKSSKINVNCNYCGMIRICVVKNYLRIISRIRIIYDNTEITGIYLCRKCSKKVQDTNKSIVEKANKSKEIFYSNEENRKIHRCKDEYVKKNSYIKMVKTCKEKYGDDHFINLFLNCDKHKRLESYKRNRIDKEIDFKKNLDDNILKLENDIKLNNIIYLDKKNKIHKEFIRRKLGIKEYQYIHDFFYKNISHFIKTSSFDNDVRIIKNTNINRKSRGSVKRGWVMINNFILKYESQIELSYILYKKDDFINDRLKRNSQYFIYDDNKRYYPDFYDKVDETFIEIKDIQTYKNDNKIITEKLKSCKSKIICNTDIPSIYNDLAKILINTYEKTKG